MIDQGNDDFERLHECFSVFPGTHRRMSTSQVGTDECETGSNTCRTCNRNLLGGYKPETHKRRVTGWEPNYMHNHPKSTGSSQATTSSEHNQQPAAGLFHKSSTTVHWKC